MKVLQDFKMSRFYSFQDVQISTLNVLNIFLDRGRGHRLGTFKVKGRGKGFKTSTFQDSKIQDFNGNGEIKISRFQDFRISR